MTQIKACRRCGETKTEDQFGFIGKSLRPYCRPCNAVVRKERGYDKNEAERSRRRNAAKRVERLAKLVVEDKAVAEAVSKASITRALALLAHPQVRAALREALKEDLTFLD